MIDSRNGLFVPVQFGVSSEFPEEDSAQILRDLLKTPTSCARRVKALAQRPFSHECPRRNHIQQLRSTGHPGVTRQARSVHMAGCQVC